MLRPVIRGLLEGAEAQEEEIIERINDAYTPAHVAISNMSPLESDASPERCLAHAKEVLAGTKQVALVWAEASAQNCCNDFWLVGPQHSR